MSASSRAFKTVALAAGAAAAATATVKIAASRQRRHPDPYKEAAFKASFEREYEIDTFDGGTMYVIESGPIDGQPIVLCHGVTLSVRTWVCVREIVTTAIVLPSGPGSCAVMSSILRSL